MPSSICPDCGTKTLRLIERTEPDASGEFKEISCCDKCNILVHVYRCPEPAPFPPLEMLPSIMEETVVICPVYSDRPEIQSLFAALSPAERELFGNPEGTVGQGWFYDGKTKHIISGEHPDGYRYRFGGIDLEFKAAREDGIEIPKPDRVWRIVENRA